MLFQYEEENVVKIKKDVELEFVLAYLERMNPKTRSFCTLSNQDESYVQCAGSKLRMIVEHRGYQGSGFTHYVLGKNTNDLREHSINYSGGIIRLKRNEILSVNDAKIVFQSFYLTQKMPEGYCLRDNTQMFVKSEKDR
ncbi:MAG TPA: hypothetical protein PLH87_07390 [Bacillota bacterium]|jgi:hypothetical protein|nr:hypothetical protein [Bacillota bacterium]